MFEHTTEKGSVWVTLKHCKFILLFISLTSNFLIQLLFIFKILIVNYLFNYSSASDKSKVQRNEITSAGNELEYKCLVRATDGKKNISTLVKNLNSVFLHLFFWYLNWTVFHRDLDSCYLAMLSVFLVVFFFWFFFMASFRWV